MSYTFSIHALIYYLKVVGLDLFFMLLYTSPDTKVVGQRTILILLSLTEELEILLFPFNVCKSFSFFLQVLHWIFKFLAA